MIIACGDAGLTTKGMNWSIWNGKHALGSGDGTIKTCIPDCAAGGTMSGAIQLALSKPRTCRSGVRVFSKLRYTWTQGAPVGPDGKPIGPDTSAIGIGCKLLEIAG